MCAVDWQMLLEYVKVFLSWPPILLVVAYLLISKFRAAIDDFLKRLVEGNIFGQIFKAAPPRQQSSDATVRDDPLARAAEAAPQTVGLETKEPMPPELAGDPQAIAAVAFVQSHPAQTVVQYRKILFAYNSERLFARIYGTQIELLEFLASRQGAPVPLSMLKPFHDEHQKKSGSTEYQIRDYVNFLVGFGVVAVSGPENEFEYAITQHGVEFLSYIKASYPEHWLQRAF